MASGDPPFIDIDGNQLEGGGQILRMSTVFSVLLGKPVRIFNIRAGRAKPGLRPQHLTGLRLARDICSGQLSGDQENSCEIRFAPGPVRSGDFVCDTKTAGSITLLMQVALPCLAFSKGVSRVTMRGGTHTGMAPPIDYTVEILRPILERMGIRFDCNVIRRGYYPKGGGEAVMTVQPAKAIQSRIMIDRGDIGNIRGQAWTAGTIPPKACHSMRDTIVRVLAGGGYPESEVESYVVPNNISIGNEKGAHLIAETTTGCLIGASGLGRRDYQISGTTAEQIGSEAAEALLQNLASGGCVDEHLQDQLIVFMALGTGQSRIRTGEVSLHTKTAIYVAELMTKAKFSVTQDGQTSIITCEGIGFTASE